MQLYLICEPNVLWAFLRILKIFSIIIMILEQKDHAIDRLTGMMVSWKNPKNRMPTYGT